MSTSVLPPSEMQLPIDDKLSHDKRYLEARLAILMAGRIAEEIFLDQMTTGAGNDIERATEMAHKMVCEWGMSELGPLSFGKKDEQIFLGREIAQHRDYSEETAIKIDRQVRKLVEDGYNQAKEIIQSRSDALVRIAEALLEREVLDGSEVLDLINGKSLPKVAASKPTTTVPPSDGTVIAPHPTPAIPGLMGGESPQPA
jgi:cell division protease FtsH